jgi:hypothetical protein
MAAVVAIRLLAVRALDFIFVSDLHLVAIAGMR